MLRENTRPKSAAWLARAMLLAGLSVGIWQCGYDSLGVSILGYEANDEACSDGEDNDRDGRIDCEDVDCIYGSTFCGEIIPAVPQDPVPETTYARCNDGVDNDLDGKFDCGDPNCQAIPENCCAREFDNQSCSDGRDNDGNGFIDCADFNCRNNTYVTVCKENSDETCGGKGAGVDEDGDGFFDCDDSDCIGTANCPGEPENSLEKCTDGKDNDGNGFRDCGDFSCTNANNGASAESIAHCKQNAENTVERCRDGIDNDGNGFTDCGDFSCSSAKSGAPAGAVEYCNSIAENTLERCKDGVDNDGDGFVDCADFSCNLQREELSSLNDDQKALKAYCESVTEATAAKCSDDEDNDGNGFTDCQDNSCRFSSDPAVRQVCQESYSGITDKIQANAEVVAKCSDGVDNDGDGFVDCDDWDCSWNPAVIDAKACPGTKVCE